MLAAPAAALLLQIAVLAFAWHMLLGTAWGKAPGLRLSGRSFLSGWLSRYIPGPPSGVAGKFLSCRRAGVAPAAITAALVSEQLLQLSACLLLPALLAPFVLGWWGLAIGAAGVGGAGLVLAVAAHPAATGWTLKALRRLGARSLAEQPPTPPRSLVGPQLLMVGAAVLAAISFHIVAVALTDVRPGQWEWSLFVFGTASLAGFVIPFLPSGAGAREAIIVALLAPEVGHIDALSVAVIARGVAILLDAALAGGALGVATAAQLSILRRASIETLSKKRL